MFDFESGSLSYVKLFWGSQIVLVGGTALVKIISGAWDKTKNHKSPEEQIGIFEFRRRPAAYYSVGFLFTSWTAWNAFSAYHYGTVPNYYLSKMFSLLTTPSERTITSSSALLASTMLEIHFLRRLYESLEVSIISHKQVIGLLTAALNFEYGIAAIMSIYAEAPEFVSQSDCLDISSFGRNQVIAIMLYGLGSYIQRKTLDQLADMRRNKYGHVTSTDYKIPRGPTFRLSNSPHYLAEIMIYTSIALAMDMKNTTWLWLLSYVTTNQLFMTLSNRQFYSLKQSKSS